MAKKSITFRLVAYSEAAGKYNPAAPREGNEDNFYIDDDLSDDQPGNCQPDKIVTMSDCGCLMVVADGMGGMNAGEVASEIAIKTVEDYFSPGKIAAKIANSKAERKHYLENVIREADRNIKLEAKNNPEHEGMGSTIILAWIVGNQATISWCGDSRAYRFNPINGIEPLSRDHSYVQELVNQHRIPYEATFDHPQNNIVTRSLGDPNNAAKPETRDFEVYNGDIILVCSDGLSGVLRDKKTLLPDNSGNYYPGENIEDIIRDHQESMIECKDSLMNAAQNADWYDNVTVLLCQILSGASAPIKKERPNPPIEDGTSVMSTKKVLTISAIAILFVLFGCCCYFFGTKHVTTDTTQERYAGIDTTGTSSDSIQEVSSEVAAAIGAGAAGVGAKDLNDDRSQASQDHTLGKNETPDSWENVQMKKIEPYKTGPLKQQVAYVESAISKANIGNQSQISKNKQFCQNLVSQILNRAKYIQMLQAIEDKVTDTATYKKFWALLTSEMTERIPNLLRHEQFISIQSFINNQESSGDDENGTTAEELTEYNTPNS